MNAPVRREASILEKLQSKEVREALKAVLPQTMNADRFLSMAVAAAKMQAASKYVTDKMSILLAVYNAAKLGLDLNEQLGHAFLVPFKGKVVLIPGYKGLIELVRRSGQISNMTAFIVYEKEVQLKQWKYWRDENGEHFEHTPYMGADHGPVHCVVSVAYFKDSTLKPSVDVMRLDEVLAIKERSLARTPKSPWGEKDYEPAMMKKTVIRRHCKTLPISVEAATVVEADEKIERGETPAAELPESLRAALNAEDAEFSEAPADAAEQPAGPPPEFVAARECFDAAIMQANAAGALAEASALVNSVLGGKSLDDLDIAGLTSLTEDVQKIIAKKGAGNGKKSA